MKAQRRLIVPVSSCEKRSTLLIDTSTSEFMPLPEQLVIVLGRIPA